MQVVAAVVVGLALSGCASVYSDLDSDVGTSRYPEEIKSQTRTGDLLDCRHTGEYEGVAGSEVPVYKCR